MITHVAIKDDNGKVWSLPKPNRHGDVIEMIRRATTVSPLLTQHVQGFLNNRGEFLTRQEAWHEAHACNQILPPYNPVDPSQRAWELQPSDTPTQLFSEDIW